MHNVIFLNYLVINEIFYYTTLYSLRCASCFKSSILSEYDDVIQLTLKVILNVNLSDTIWKQATFPVSRGGLGVCLSMDLALPAFLSSVIGALELTLLLLPSRLLSMSGNRDPVYFAVCLEWQTRCCAAVPDSSRFKRYGICAGCKPEICQLHKTKLGVSDLLRLLLLILVTSQTPFRARYYYD